MPEKPHEELAYVCCLHPLKAGIAYQQPKMSVGQGQVVVENGWMDGCMDRWKWRTTNMYPE